MKIRPQQKMSSRLKGLKRITGLSDVVAVGGNYLYRKGIQSFLFTIPTSVALLLHSKYTDAELYNALVPIAMSLGSVSIGGLAKLGPGMYRALRMGFAEGNESNLLAHYRQRQLPYILDELIEHAYFPESKVKFTPQQIANCTQTMESHFAHIKSALQQMDPETKSWAKLDDCLDEVVVDIAAARPIHNTASCSKLEILTELRSGLKDTKTQSQSFAETGYDISILEDWLDGAPFHERDKKLQNQLVGNVHLRQIQKLTAQSEYLKNFESTFDTICSGFMFGLYRKWVFRETLLKTAAAVIDVEEKFPQATRINAESLLVPGDYANVYHRQFEGLSEYLAQKSQEIMRSVYGPTKQDAIDTVNRLTMYTCMESIGLRLKYDPEYAGCNAAVSRTFIDDLATLGVKHSHFENLEKRISFEQKQYAHQIALFAPDANPEQVRALQIAHHINYRGITDELKSYREKRAIYDSVLAQTTEFSERLVECRIMTTLSQIERKLYIDHVLALGNYT
jgi:hypothetical protein